MPSLHTVAHLPAAGPWSCRLCMHSMWRLLRRVGIHGTGRSAHAPLGSCHSTGVPPPPIRLGSISPSLPASEASSRSSLAMPTMGLGTTNRASSSTALSANSKHATWAAESQPFVRPQEHRRWHPVCFQSCPLFAPRCACSPRPPCRGCRRGRSSGSSWRSWPRCWRSPSTASRCWPCASKSLPCRAWRTYGRLPRTWTYRQCATQ